MTTFIGFIVQIGFFVAVTSLIDRMRMKTSRQGETIEIGFPKWVRVVYFLMLSLFSAFVMALISIAMLALLRGLWGVTLFFAIIGSAFAGLCLWGMRDCRRTIIIDETGIAERRGKYSVAIEWNDMSVNTWKKLTGALITDGKQSEIVIPSNATGLDLVEEAIRHRVPAARISFSMGADGQRHIFPNVSNLSLERSRDR